MSGKKSPRKRMEKSSSYSVSELQKLTEINVSDGTLLPNSNQRTPTAKLVL